MTQIIVVVREPDSTELSFSLEFEVPEVPRQGDYISIRRHLDTREPFGEDVVVRRVWWRLRHPQTHGFGSSDKPTIGDLVEIFVECEAALSPYSSEDWRRNLERAREEGRHVEEFDCRSPSLPTEQR